MVLNKNNLGIIAGSGLLPSEIADLHLKQGGNVYIAVLEGETDILHITKYQYKQFPIGSVGALLEYFRENNVKEKGLEKNSFLSFLRLFGPNLF